MANSNIKERTKIQRKAIAWTLAFGVLMFLCGWWLAFSCCQAKIKANEVGVQKEQVDSLNAQNNLLAEYAIRWDTLYRLAGTLEGKNTSEEKIIENDVTKKKNSIKEWVEYNKEVLDMNSIFISDQNLLDLTIEIIKTHNRCYKTENECCLKVEILEGNISQALIKLRDIKISDFKKNDSENRWQHSDRVGGLIDAESSKISGAISDLD